MISTVDRLPDTVVLHPGQALRTSIEAATWLEMVEGCAELSAPPSWFGDAVFTARTVLNDGDVHRTERGGWIELLALTSVRLRVHAPQAVAAAPVSMQGAERPVMRFMRLLTGW